MQIMPWDVKNLRVGDQVDALATDCDVYCPATIVQVSPVLRLDWKGWNEGEIQWQSEVEEDDHLKPPGTHVTLTKAWVKIRPNVCYWPCRIYIRRPRSEEGVEYLKEEQSIFVEPFGEAKLFLKRYIKGAWIRVKNIRPWGSGTYQKRQGALGQPTNVRELFSAALAEADKSDILAVHFEFDGTYDRFILKKLGSSLDSKRANTELKPCPLILSMFEPMRHRTDSTMHDFYQFIIQSQNAQTSEEAAADSAKKRKYIRIRDILSLTKDKMFPNEDRHTNAENKSRLRKK